MEFHPYAFVMPRNESGEMQKKNFRSSREELKILPKTAVKKKPGHTCTFFIQDFLSLVCKLIDRTLVVILLCIPFVIIN